MKRILAYFFLLITVLCALGCIILAIGSIMLSNELQAANAGGHEYLPLVVSYGILVSFLVIGTISFLLFLLCK